MLSWHVGHVLRCDYYCYVFVDGLEEQSGQTAIVTLIESLHLKGDEMVLDVGCGRRVLLIEAANHMPDGNAIGIDLWQSVDLSGNNLEETMTNAEAEVVAERVKIRTGDMRKFPFLDASIYVVVARQSIHKIADKEGRAQAVHKINRVLKTWWTNCSARFKGYT